MKKWVTLLSCVLWTGVSFANEQTVKNVAEVLSRDFQVSSFEIKKLEGPLVKIKETVYKIQISRNYALGLSSTRNDDFHVYLLSETKSVGPMTEKKMKIFGSVGWDFVHNKVPARYQGSWSGADANINFTIKASPEIQQDYLVRMLELLASELR